MENKQFYFWQDHSRNYLEMALSADRHEVPANPDGYGKRIGDCGDTVEMFLIFQNEKLRHVSIRTNGCMNTHACANTVAYLAEDKTLKEAWNITPESVIHYLETLPSENHHCAELAVGAFYLALASGFGLPLNSLPFELLSKGIPFQVMTNFRDNPGDLEALLFGHSGLLYPARNRGSYPSSLWERYGELRHKLPGDPVPHHLWKFLRLRPVSFPTLRISQFAHTLHQRIPLLDSILSSSSLTELEQLLRSGASEYWDFHYLFGKCSPPFPKYLGQQSVATLIVNVIIPFLHALERLEPDKKYAVRISEILSQMKAESNQVIHRWNSYGVRAENAGESQALLQLFNVYCKQKRCLHCQIGMSLMEAAIHEKK
jgi:NifU-like protein involved in Fe-S cluster formation